MPKTIQIANLTKDVTAEKLKDLFRPYGVVENSEPTFEYQSSDLYYGLVEINSVDEAKNAVSKLHGITFHGKRISVSVLPDKPTTEHDDLELR